MLSGQKKSNTSNSRIGLGMSSFGINEREQFGQNLRLAMACIEGPSVPTNTPAIPSDESGICDRLKTLAQEESSSLADFLELLVRFDELEGWKSRGAAHCAAWVNYELGVSPQLGWAYLRAGRQLRSLPTTAALFRAGKLTWSKVRCIASVADKDTEKTLCHASLDASYTDVKLLCGTYRWSNDADENSGDNDRAVKQWNSRSLSWKETSIGSTLIQIALPPELAQAFLNSIEQSLSQVGDELENEPDDKQRNISQRRADAAVLMAETSLQAAGREMATADRYQVIVSVDASELSASEPKLEAELHPAMDTESIKSQQPVSQHKCAKSGRATIKGAGPVARDTARRIACDCSFTHHTTQHGELTDIGRKSRLWPAAMSRAIKDRDQHCQYPGCSKTHQLQIHHIVHWADGGVTSIDNGVSVCQFHHTMLHEGGHVIQKVEGDEQIMAEQFANQQHANDLAMFDVEKQLRNDQDSFAGVRALSPTRYRFRVVDANGNDIRYDQSNVQNAAIANFQYPTSGPEDIRVSCAEPVSGSYTVSRRAVKSTRSGLSPPVYPRGCMPQHNFPFECQAAR